MRKPLRISHLTSKKQLAETLSNFQSGPDSEVSCFLLNLKESLKTEDLTDNLKSTDILHLHGIDLLQNQELLKLIDNRIKNKEVVILSLFDDTDIFDEDLNQAILKNSELLNESSAVFIQDSAVLPHLDALWNWSWCASPISTPFSDASETNFEPHGEIKFLYHEGTNDAEFRKKLDESFQKLKDEGYALSFTSFKSSGMAEDEARLKIQDCNVLIDCQSLPALNSFTLTALSLGKTVLANIPENSERLSKQFEYAPILKTNGGNLYYRMKSLCMQPISLRDFGRRGLKYIQDYHNPKLICGTYLEIYRQFV